MLIVLNIYLICWCKITQYQTTLQNISCYYSRILTAKNNLTVRKIDQNCPIKI